MKHETLPRSSPTDVAVETENQVRSATVTPRRVPSVRAPSMETSSPDAQGFAWCRRAIVFLDAVNYSGLMDRAPLAARRRVKALVNEAERLAELHDGRLVERAGDGAFLEFDAASGAVAAMRAFLAAARWASLEPDAAQAEFDAPVRFRVGITFGDVLHDGELPAGAIVNSAKRLETMAEPGAMNVSDAVRAALPPDEQAWFRDGGFRLLKGQTVPVRVWRSPRPGPSEGACAETTDATSHAGRSIRDMAHSYVLAVEPEAENHSIAVMRFVTQGIEQGPDATGGDDDYFATGLAADVVAGLSRVRSLLIVSPRTSLSMDARGRQPCEIARELGVRYLVEGRVARSRGPQGERLRVSASLVSCPGNQIVWSHRYDRTAEDLFAIQDDIAASIVATIEPAFWRAEWERAARPQPRNLAHWDLLMRANWSFWRSHKAANLAAQEMAEQALALKPDDCGTHALLAMCRAQRVWANWSADPVAELEAGIACAREAVRLDPYNARGHFTLGATLTLSARHGEAAACQHRALELNPHFAASMGELGRVMAHRGRTAAARDLALKAIRRSAADPHLGLWIRTLALADFVDGNYASAARFAREAVSARPDWFFNHHLLAASLHLAGRRAEARAAMEEANHLKPRYSLHAMRAAHPFENRRVATRFEKALRASGWAPTASGAASSPHITLSSRA